MTTKYVKFIAKPDTWYMEESEVFHEDADYGKRISLDEYHKLMSYEGVGSGGIGMIGIRVCKDNPNENALGYKAGDLRMDGEWCDIDEFDIQLVDEQFSCDIFNP